LQKKPRHILRGHDEEVTCVAVDVDFDICASGSLDSTVVIHTLEYGRYVQTIPHPNRCPVHKICISKNGNIVMYSTGDNFLHLFSINGNLIRSKNADDVISNMMISRERDLLFTGGRRIIMRQVYNLEVLHIFENFGFASKITSFGLSIEEQQIFVGLENGKLILIAEPSRT